MKRSIFVKKESDGSMEICFITTDHLEDRLWFRDDDDFKAGMNRVAILSETLHIPVLAFILMSNHVHFVLQCSYDQALRFINLFKKAHSRHLWKKYGTHEALQGVKVDIQIIEMSDEHLERVIAYTLMNCVAANICTFPADYPWGSGNCYFRTKAVKGTPLRNFSGRERIRLLHSKKELSSRLMVCEDGYILPDSYIQVPFVEKIFRTPKRMNYFLQNSSKAKLRLSRSEEGRPAFRDQVIAAALPDLCQSLFHCRRIIDLNEKQLAELLRQVRFRFAADVNQIARTVGFSYERVARLLEDY